MITTREYAKLKRTIHKFTQEDILNALRCQYKISSSGKQEFEIFDNEQDKDRTMAILTICHEEKE